MLVLPKIERSPVPGQILRPVQCLVGGAEVLEWGQLQWDAFQLGGPGWKKVLLGWFSLAHASFALSNVWPRCPTQMVEVVEVQSLGAQLGEIWCGRRGYIADSFRGPLPRMPFHPQPYRRVKHAVTASQNKQYELNLARRRGRPSGQEGRALSAPRLPNGARRTIKSN